MSKTKLETIECSPIIYENIYNIYRASNNFTMIFDDYFKDFSFSRYKYTCITLKEKIKILQETSDELGINYNFKSEIASKKLILKQSGNESSNGCYLFRDNEHKIIIQDTDNITTIPVTIHEISHWLDYKKNNNNREVVDYFTETIAYATEILSIFSVIRKENKYKKDLLVFLNSVYYRLLTLIKKILPLLKILIVQKEYGYVDRTTLKNIWGAQENFDFYLYYIHLIKQETINLLEIISYSIAPHESIILLRKPNLVKNLRAKLANSTIQSCLKLYQVDNDIPYLKEFSQYLNSIK